MVAVGIPVESIPPRGDIRVLALRALARRSSFGNDRRAGAPRPMLRATNPIVIATAIKFSLPAEPERSHGLPVYGHSARRAEPLAISKQ